MVVISESLEKLDVVAGKDDGQIVTPKDRLRDNKEKDMARLFRCASGHDQLQ